MDNEQLYQSMPGNLTFLQGCAASLVGQDVLVDTKALEAEPITVAGSTAAALGLTFVFVLPAAVLIAGQWWCCCAAADKETAMKQNSVSCWRCWQRQCCCARRCGQ